MIILELLLFLTMTVAAMKGMYKTIVVPAVLYGSEAWVLNAKDVSRVEAVEICLRSMCGVTKYDRMRNKRIREQTGVQMRMGERAEQAKPRWYGHVMRMDEGRYLWLLDKAPVAEIVCLRPPSKEQCMLLFFQHHQE